MVKASVVGATGYAGAELMRLLTAHQQVTVTHAISKSFAGQKMSDLYPSFFTNDYTLEELDFEVVVSDSDIVFTCLPHGASAETAAQLLAKGVKVIYQEDDTVSIELHIIVDNGVNLHAVSEAIMSEVRYTVGKLTGAEVRAVDVYIDSMDIE